MQDADRPTVLARRRVWRFGDEVNTDVMMPGHALLKAREEQPQYVFEANRPGWSSQVQPGDVIVAGSGFGTGSGRPASRAFLQLGIAAIVVESANGLFLRNSVSYGLPCLEVKGVSDAFNEDDSITVDLDRWVIIHDRTGQELPARPLPDSLRETMLGGGTIPRLVEQGFLGSAEPYIIPV